MDMFRGNHNVLSGNRTENPNDEGRGANSMVPPQQKKPQMKESDNITAPVKSMVFTRNENSTTQDEQIDAVTPADDSLLRKKVHATLTPDDDLIAEQNDPTSPLFSVKTFEELQLLPELIKSISLMGFRKPSKIQEMILPRLLAQCPANVIAQSQSGTGKTAAFSLSILSRIDPNIPFTQALVLVPTFELALQIGSVMTQIAQFLPYAKVGYAVRQSYGAPKIDLVRGQLLQEPIIVGTPGTVQEWAMRRKVIDLSRLRIFCVDEADVMIDTQGFGAMCAEIAQNVNQQSCQFMLFSATYTDEVIQFAKQIVPRPVTLRLKREKQALNNIVQYYIKCKDFIEKYEVLKEIYSVLDIGQAMIFCKTKRTARELNIAMVKDNFQVRELTSDLDIEQRAAVIEAFRRGLFRVLISTNLTSRGIDIHDVSLVMNFDLPVHYQSNTPDFETYLHRIGRCGRFGKIGYAFNLISTLEEESILNSIMDHFQRPMKKLERADILNLMSADA